MFAPAQNVPRLGPDPHPPCTEKMAGDNPPFFQFFFHFFALFFGKLQKGTPHDTTRGDDLAAYEGEIVAHFAWGRELLPGRPPACTESVQLANTMRNRLV